MLEAGKKTNNQTFTHSHPAWCQTADSAPEAGVVEGVQVGGVGPPDGVAFAAQLHVPPWGQAGALAQAQEASPI